MDSEKLIHASTNCFVYTYPQRRLVVCTVRIAREAELIRVISPSREFWDLAYYSYFARPADAGIHYQAHTHTPPPDDVYERNIIVDTVVEFFCAVIDDVTTWFSTSMVVDIRIILLERTCNLVSILG
jgi:hypothetical protein